MAILPGQVINRRYRVTRSLGHGGMGSVYLVHDTHWGDRPIALKLLRPDALDAGATELFKQEFRAMTRLRHPNLAEVYDFGTDGETGRLFLTMEYVDGRDLTAWRGPDAYAAFEELTVQGLRALDYVHSRGLLHNDIKPQNILVRSPLQVKVLDFGLANPRTEPTRLGLSGTLHYIAPERFKGRLADARSDLYSLGVVLYELLTGQLPFQAEDPGRVVTAIMQGRFRPPRELNPAIEARFEKFVVALLAMDPQARPATASAALDLLNDGSSRPRLLDTPETRASYITSGAFVARDRELSSLLQAAEAHVREPGSDATPRLILVNGPSGIGKSRLLREAKYHLQLSGIRNLTGRCHEDGGVPYQPIVEILRQVPRPDGLSPEAGVALDEVLHPRQSAAGDAVDPGPRAPARDKGEFLTALAAALDAAGRETPGVLFVEGLQWSDAPGIDLIEHLLLRPARGRWLMVAALREDDRPGPALSFMRRYGGYLRVRTMPLSPLREAEIVDLLVSMMPFEEQPGALAHLLADRTGGNPLYVEELVQSLAEKGAVRRKGGTWVSEAPGLESAGLPDTLAAVLSHRIESLPPRERTVLEAMSVVNRPATAALIARIAGLGHREIAFSLGALEDLRMVYQETQRTGPALASLAHSRIREAAYGALTEDRKRALHVAAGRSIEAAHPDSNEGVVEELAHHFFAAGERDPAIEYSLRAANKAELLFYPRRQCDFLEQALQLLPADDPRRPRALYQASTTKFHDLGDFEGALQNGEALLEDSRRRRNRKDEVRGLRCVAMAKGYMGDSAGALEAAQRSVAVARSDDDRDAVMRCLNFVGIIHARKGEPRQAVGPFEEALGLSEALGDFHYSFPILSNLGLTELGLGNTAKARHLMERLLEIARQHGVTYWYNRSLPNYGVGLLESGDLPGSLKAVEEGLAWAREHVNIEVLVQSLSNLALARGQRGLHEQSLRAIEEEIQVRRSAGDRAQQAYALEQAGTALREIGRPQEAEARHREGLEIAVDLKQKTQEGFLLAALARDKMAGGSVDAAAELARRAADIAREQSHARLGAIAACVLARCAALRGDRKELNTLIRTLGRVDGKALRFYDRLEVNLTLGRCYLAAGKAAEAEREARAGARAAEAGGFREYAWKFQALLGEIFTSRKLPDEARRSYNAALSFVRQIAADFGDPVMRDSYQNDSARHEVALRAASPEFPQGSAAGAPSSTAVTGAAPGAGQPGRDSGSPLPPGSLAGVKGDPFRTLSALYQITQIVNSILDLKELLSKVMDLAIDIVGAERGLIFLYRSDTDEMEMVVARNMERQTIKDATEYSQSVVREAGYGRSILSHDAVTDERFKEYRSVSIYHIRSLLCVPLRARNRVLGTVYVDTRQEGVVFTPEDQQFLESFANQAAIAIENARLYDQIRQENVYLKQAVDERYGYENIIGRSPKMREVFAMLRRIATSTLPALIRGESGTGKELVARAIHQNSPRRDRKFYSENCAALPDTLLESELFGHVKGAFTGADATRKGLFELADGGTLFLDEIGDMTPSLQSKLLRVLQDGEMRPVGSESSRHVDVRIVSATSRDLEAMIAARQFRQDLYFRVNVITLTLPPLRDRRDDIPLLVDHFLTRIAQTNKSPKLRIDRDLMSVLLRYEWPGNVRELENRISRLALFANGDGLGLHDANQDPDFYAKVTATTSAPGAAGIPVHQVGDVALPYHGATYPGAVSLEAPPPDPAPAGHAGSPAASEAARLKQALIDANGSRDEAARLLGISRATLFRKLKQYQIREKGSRSFRRPEQV